ncbi:sugar ABC transporter permease [Jatrophihabitans telluris]|uniref:Sugar ABC transporter permease n=1 Tax=Jatrophihabitans telluris TaxID=2038343 RepID=A0ABY4R0R9_9ACTN|nr:sugar ABC transporter permease [Jatrophihabitans telluris]UQX89062.1 sugar ABC transporter permease [Jatrophihabitans telluris]
MLAGPARSVKGAEARRSRRRRPDRARWWVVLGFLSPFLIGLAVFVVYPVLATLYYSFTDYQAGSYQPVNWVGLRNYRTMFADTQVFWVAVRNTVWMVLIMVPIQTVWAIFVAWILTRIRRGALVYRTIYFLPAMVPIVATALSFIVMLNPVGPLNHLLSDVGITGPGWFSDAAWSKPSLVLMALWTVGNTMILFLAGMLDVPKSLYEAAEIDGAGAWKQFLHVTLPGISPIVFFSLLTGMIYTFQYFTEAFVASGSANPILSSNESIGYPQDSLLFYTTEIYRQGFQYFRTGYASAMAWLLFLVIFAFTLVFIRGSRRWVYYGGAR